MPDQRGCMGSTPTDSGRTGQRKTATTAFIFETIGWYGTSAIVLAYLLANLGILNVESTSYQMLNLSGALGIVFISLRKKAYQPAVLNIIWAVIALAAIGRAVW